MKRLCGLGTAMLLTFSPIVSGADIEKDGVRITVNKKTLDRADRGKTFVTFREIDRTMTLKTVVKNISMKPFPEATLEYILLIRRWALSESGTLERHKGSLKLDPLKPAQEADLLVGEFHIAGHMHGNSDEHVDQLAAWKIIVDRDGKKTEFMSNPSFTALDKRAVNAAR